MGRRKVETENRRKGVAGGGRARKRATKEKNRSARDAHDQLAALVKKRKKQLKKEGKEADDSTGFEKAVDSGVVASRQVTVLPFERFFWVGERPTAGPPSEELKMQRKKLGIKLRGVAAPPPVEAFDAPGLPRVFSGFVKAKRKTGNTQLEKPSAIQAQVWPSALCGLDVIGIAPTGSGKTLAYILPAVSHVLGQKPEKRGKKGAQIGPSCLVLVPTRELAQQVCEVCGGNASGAWLNRLFGLRSGAVYGGIGKEMQIDTITSLGAPHILSATPGRLLDLVGLTVLTLDTVTYLVLDEADRMLALGFELQLSTIMKLIRPNRQALLFSATFPQALRDNAEEWMAKDKVVIRVSTLDDDEDDGKKEAAAADGGDAPAKTNAAADSKSRASTLTVSPTIHQTVHVCSEHKKQKKLLSFLWKMRSEEKQSSVRQRSAVLIFCSQIKKLREVAAFLEKNGERCAPLHSGIAQANREWALESLKVGRIDTLVATDVASRGLHITRLKYVVNYDFPSNLESYCHRIGRVGRQGVEGWAFSFFTRNLAPLAPGLVQILSSTKQWVDPNLRELAEKGEKAGDAPEAEDMPSVPSALRPGVAVRIGGLKASPELNGTCGRVRQSVPDSNRWEIVLEESGGVKAFKADNLTCVADPGPSEKGLCAGAPVKIQGLKASPQLNGSDGRVLRFIDESKRWEVAIQGSDEVKALRAENLEVVSLEEGDAASSEDSGDEKDEEDEESEESDVPAPVGDNKGSGIRIAPQKRKLSGSEDDGSDSEAEAEDQTTRKAVEGKAEPPPAAGAGAKKKRPPKKHRKRAPPG